MNILTIGKENFTSDVLENKLPVLIDFWAPWCGYCRRLSPAVDQIAEEYEGKLVVGKINIDDDPDLAEQFEIETIPSLLLFKDGKASEPIIAPASKSQVSQWLSENGVE